jgi:hypothetical protein
LALIGGLRRRNGRRLGIAGRRQPGCRRRIVLGIIVLPKDLGLREARGRAQQYRRGEPAGCASALCPTDIASRHGHSVMATG